MSLVTRLVMQITEADTEIFLLFGIQAKAASTTCSILANNWRGYYITRMDCPMSKRPGVTLNDSLPVAKTVIPFIQLSDCVAECHLAFRISQLPLFRLHSRVDVAKRGWCKAESTDGLQHLQARAYLLLQCLYP